MVLVPRYVQIHTFFVITILGRDRSSKSIVIELKLTCGIFVTLS